jgi:hypothetical protein
MNSLWGSPLEFIQARHTTTDCTKLKLEHRRIREGHVIGREAKRTTTGARTSAGPYV